MTFGSRSKSRTQAISMTMPTNMGENPTDLDELILLKNKTTIPAFESTILYCRTHRTMMMGYKLHIMSQATYPEDQANLPIGVYVVKTYTELHDGSHNVSVVLHNLTGKPVHLPAGRPVAWVVAANAIPDATPSLEFLKKLNEMEPDRNPPRKDDYRREAEVTAGTALERGPTG